MRTLFLRIFLSFWFAMLVIGGGFLGIDYLEKDEARHARFIEILSLALSQAGEHALPKLQEQLDQGRAEHFDPRTEITTYLFAETALQGDSSPEARFALEVLDQPEGLWRADETTDRYGEVVELSSGRYVFVATLWHPTWWSHWLHPETLIWRLLLFTLVSGLVCLLLARYITKPLRYLRQATYQLAQASPGVRVADRIGPRKDELSALAHDFDTMADRIESLLEAQRRLLRDVSHELRSPLARLNVALALAQTEVKAGSEYLIERMEREIERLDQLVEEVLHLTRLETSNKSFEKHPLSLSQLVQEVVEDVDFEMRERGRTIRTHIAPDVEVCGILEVLRRAVENVIRNAALHTPRSAELRVSLTAAKGQALLRVEDDGPGVPENALKEIFQPFARVQDARDRSSGGVGLGLAITARAVQLHQGEVNASNLPQGGLEVSISLPCLAQRSKETQDS